MKNIPLLILLFCFSTLLFSCKKKVQIEIIGLKTAIKDVQRFHEIFPDSIECDSSGTNCKYPVGNYYTTYSIHFKKINGDIEDSLDLKFPEYDFSQIKENFPESAVGVRIYEAIDDNNHIVNYLTYSKLPKMNSEINEDNPRIPDDIMEGNSVYKITNAKFDLREFKILRESKKIKTPLSNHRSCSPDCPEHSLLNEKL